MTTEAKPKIFIIDDAPENIRILAQALKTDYKTTFATAGAQAIKFAMSEEPPDLILLDIMMPEMDGFQFVEEIRKHETWQKIPIVVITAKDITDEDKLRLNGYVEKILQKGSYSRDELLSMVRNLLKR